jgi:hypothetical protein
MAQRPGSFIGQCIVTLVCLIAGVIVTFFVGLPMYRKAQASQSWPTADGKIEMSRVNSSLEKGKWKYSSSVGYTYELKGQTHTSNYVWASGGYSSSSKSPHQAVVDKYPVGKTVKVYYDPKKPEFAILEPGVTTTNYIVIGAGIVFLLAGVVMTGATLFRIVAIGRMM